MPSVSSIRGEITLDSSGYKKGIDQAKQATQQFASEADRATVDCKQFMDALEKEGQQAKRTGDALRQENAFLKEMAGLESRLTAIREGDNRVLQQAAQRYSDLSRAEQLEVAAARSAIVAHEAQQKAIADAASAAERAAAREIAATERAAAAAERAAQRRLSASRIGQGLASAGRSLSLGVTAPILGLAAGGVKLFGDMEENLNVLQQISGATNDQMKQLGDQAIALGGDMKLPATSAADAARAMVELKQAGLSVDEVMKAARPTLVLTAATGLDVAESARLAASTMNAFALPPARLTPIMDMLVAAQSAAGVKMREITPAIRQASAEFRKAGQSPESLITALAVLSKAGVRGELAGTGLRNMLVNLAKETPKVTAAMKTLGVQAFDPVTKQMKPLRTLIDEMSKSLERFTPQARSNLLNSIFGGRAQGVNVLFRGVEQFDQMALAIEKEGAAAAAAEARNKGLKGAMDALRSAFETALIQGITPIKDDLNVFARRIGEVAKAFSDLPAPVRKNIVEWLAFAAVLGPTLSLLGNLAKGFGVVRGAIQAMSTVGLLAEGAIAGPWVAAAILTIGGLAVAWKTDLLGMRTALTELGTEIGDVFGEKSQMADWGAGWKSVIQNATRDAQPLMDKLHELRVLMEQTPAGKAAVPALLGSEKVGLQDRLIGMLPMGIGTWLNDMKQRAAARAQREQQQGLLESGEGGFGGPRLGPRPRMGPPIPAGFTPLPAGTLARPGSATFGSAAAGRKPKLTAEQKEGIRFAEELAQAQGRLSAVLAGEDNIAAQVAARYHLLGAARRAVLVGVLEHIKRLQDEKKAHEEVVAAVDAARLALLKSRAAAGAGEYSRQTVALDLSKKGWSDLSKEQQRATDKVLKWKIEQKGIDQGAQQIESLKKGLGDLQLQYEGLTAATEIQRYAAAVLHRHWGTLSDDEKILAARSFYLQQAIDAKTAADKAAADEMKRQDDALNSLDDAYAQATLRHMELSGATKADDLAFKLFLKDLDLTDREVQDLVIAYLDLIDANEKLEKLNEHNRKFLERTQQGYDDLLGTFGDLSAQYGLLTGKLSDADVFWNQITQNLDMTDEAAVNLALSIYDLYKQTQKMSESRKFMEQFAQGTQNVFEGMFHHLMEHGFKGFFRSVIDGFKQLFQQIAAQYLASQLTQLIFGQQNQGGGRTGGILGGLFGGGSGQSGALGGGGGILSTLLGLSGGVPTASGGTVPILSGGGLDTGALTLASASRRQPAVAGAGGGGGNVTINMTVHAQDAASFRKNEAHIMGSLHRAGDRLRRRDGNG